MFQGIFKSAINDANKNYIFGTGSIPIQIKSAQLATFADGTTKQQGYQVAEVNKLISTMLTGWDANGNKPKSMSNNYLELILSCDNGFIVKKRLQFPHIIAWQDDSTPYNIADVYKEFSIDNWLKADDFENPDITLVVEPTDEILTTSTATPPEATTTNSGRFYLYYRNLPIGVNRIHIDFHIKTKTEPIDFDLEVIDGMSWKDAQAILASNEQAKINVLLSGVKDVYKYTGAEGNFDEITMHEWSALYQQIISLNPNNKFTHDLYFYLYEESEINTKLTDLEASTISLYLSASENTHIMLPFLKNGVKLRLTDLNASTRYKLYLRKVVNSGAGQVEIGMIQDFKSKEITLEDDYSCIFVYDPEGVDVSFSVTLLDGKRIEKMESLLNSVKTTQDGLVKDVQNTSANIAKVDAKVDAMNDGLQFSYTSETGLKYKYFYQSFLKQGTKLSIKNLKNEYSRIYFRYQGSNQLILDFSPNEEKTIILEREYDSIFLYWENNPPTTWNFLFKVISSADETLTEVTPIIEKSQERGTEVAASPVISGKYIEGNGNLGTLESFSVYPYEVEPNKYYFIHSSLVIGSARVFVVYSSDEFSASTALIIGPSPTAPREDYVLVKMPSNAKYVGISCFGGSEHSVFESKVISVSDLKKDVDSLKANEMPSSLNTCVELASNGEDLFISYLNPNKTEITIWFKKCMFNELYTFYRVGYRDVNRLYADTIGISSQTGITQINSTSSDNIGPMSFYPGGWAGGNHSWGNDNVTKTARCDSFAIKVDGYAITPGEKIYGRKVQVDVVNTIFDPSVAPEAGTTILSTPISTELVKYVVEKGNIEVSIKESFVQETTTRLSSYYGMQSMFYDDAKFITPNGQYVDWQNADGTQALTFSKELYPKFNRFIEKNGSSTAYQGTYLLPNKDGNHDKTTINVFNRSNGKTYHIVVNNTNTLPIAGSKIVWSGVYSFFKSALVDNDDLLVYEGLINGKDAIFVWAKRVFSGAVQLPQIYSMRAILDIEKDSTITTDNVFVDSDGISINATGSGSWIFVVE